MRTTSADGCQDTKEEETQVEEASETTWVAEVSTLGNWLGLPALLQGKEHSSKSSFGGRRKVLGQDMLKYKAENMKNQHNLENFLYRKFSSTTIIKCLLFDAKS